MSVMTSSGLVQLNTIPGGSQSPLRHVQFGPGCTVGHARPGGSQLPLMQIQSEAGLTVWQLLDDGAGEDGTGAGAAGARPGGSQFHCCTSNSVLAAPSGRLDREAPSCR